MIGNERNEKLKPLKILLYLLCAALMIFIMMNFYKLMPGSAFLSCVGKSERGVPD